jgi:hypothetical protein
MIVEDLKWRQKHMAKLLSKDLNVALLTCCSQAWDCHDLVSFPVFTEQVANEFSR